MALHAVYFAVLYLYSVIHGLAAEQDADCRLIPTQKDISSEFRLKASKKGVRMVYLKLKLGNGSSLRLDDEFLPDRWVWANSSKELMLSLPVQPVVSLSLAFSWGLTEHQVKSINVPLEDKPKGCVAKLNSSRQNMAIGKMLLENVTIKTELEHYGHLQPHKTHVVCVAMINPTDYSVEYKCCSMSRDILRPNQVRCDQTVDRSNWFEIFNTIVCLIAFFSTFYIPAFPLALPDYIFSLQHECDKQDRHTEEINSDPQADHLHPMRNGYVEIDQDDEEDGEIPVDDASPITISTFLFRYVRRMPDLWLSFNLKLAFLLFCVYPFFIYVEVAFTSLLSEKHIKEASKKSIRGEGISLSSLIIIVDGITLRVIIVACFIFTPFFLVLLLRPKDLLLQMTGRRCITCRVTLDACRMVGEAGFILPVAGECLVGDKIRLHLKILQHMLYVFLSFFTKLHFSCLNRIFNLFTCSVKMNNLKVSRLRSSLCIFWVLVAFVPTLVVALVFGVVCMFLYLVASVLSIVSCSPFMTLVLAFGAIFRHRFVQTVIYSYFALLYGITYFTVYFSYCFITDTVAYTIMGFTLNAKIVTPYATFFLVVVTNIHFCYANLQNRYKEVKGMISECLKQLHIDSRAPQTKDTIPTRLFWFVCRRVLPVESEMCRMLLNISLILIFLVLVVYSIIFFGNEDNGISAIFSVIGVVVAGVIPAILLKVITEGKPFKGWEKINMYTKIDSAVKDFYQETTSENTNDKGNLQTRIIEKV